MFVYQNGPQGEYYSCGCVEFKPNWQRVEEGLPEDGEKVDVVYFDEVITCDFSHGQFIKNYDDGDHRNLTNGVKYWMPLPQPPKEEE